MTRVELAAVLDGIELHAPVTMTDLREISRMLVAHRNGIETGIDVCVRGTPDRKHDGDHRVVIAVDRVEFALPVLP